MNTSSQMITWYVYIWQFWHVEDSTSCEGTRSTKVEEGIIFFRFASILKGDKPAASVMPSHNWFGFAACLINSIWCRTGVCHDELNQMKTFTNRKFILDVTVVFGIITYIFCHFLITICLTITCKELWQSNLQGILKIESGDWSCRLGNASYPRAQILKRTTRFVFLNSVILQQHILQIDIFELETYQNLWGSLKTKKQFLPADYLCFLCQCE